MEIDPNKLTYTQEFGLVSEKKFLHAYEFLHELREQFEVTNNNVEIEMIFKEAEGRLGEAKNKLNEEIKNFRNKELAEKDPGKLMTPLNKKDKKKLVTSLTDMQKELIKVLEKARIDAIGKLSAKGVEGDENKSKTEKDVKILASGGLGFGEKLRKWFFIPKATVELYHKTINHLNTQNIENFKNSLSSEEKGIYKELSEGLSGEKSEELLTRMNGVIHTTKTIDTEKVKRTTAKTLILAQPLQTAKQLKSFTAQRQSHKERKPIEKEIVIDKQKNIVVKSIHVPLNKSFHERLKRAGNYFTNIFNTMGFSSAQRTGKHLINGWLSELSFQGKSIYIAFRHAILSDKYGTNNVERKEYAMQMAKDLLTAVVLKKLDKLNMSLDEAEKREKPLPMNLSSVSLVTPDDIRAFFEGEASEKSMLKDQKEALYALQNEINKNGFFEIEGKKIPMKFRVFAFNYGVNRGAVGKLSWAPGLKLGLDYQNEMNQKSLQDLNDYFENELIGDKDSWYWQTEDRINRIEKGKKSETQTQLIKEFKQIANNMQLLLQEINQLNETKEAYLEGGEQQNQYEVGAKIILFMNNLERMVTIAKELGVEDDEGFAAAFNCMSGKDRSGLMDAMAKAFATMQEETGKIPTHRELVENQELRDKFKELLILYLLEGGGIEITETNTDAPGYKVGPEAMIYELLPEIFQNVQGMSRTTEG